MSATLDPEHEEARALVLRYGWNSTCYQLLNHGIRYWWSADREALVGYVRSGRMAIVAGAPVCAEAKLAQTVAEWEAFAAGRGWQVAYFGAEGRLQKLLTDCPGTVTVTLGAQPEWPPSEYVRAVQENASLRAQLSRARHKGVTVSEWSRERAERHPELIAVLEKWLGSKGLPTLHFLVEPETLGELRDRRLFVAERGGKPVGFVTLCPIPAQHGWLTEQFVRAPDAPNGTVELMLFEAVSAVASAGAEFVTMGIVPLVTTGIAPTAAEPKWLALLRRIALAHATRFYNFRGLSEFKAKFRPVKWQPVVVIVKDTRFRYRHLRAIGQAFTCIPPELALLGGLARAVRTELRDRFAR